MDNSKLETILEALCAKTLNLKANIALVTYPEKAHRRQMAFNKLLALNWSHIHFPNPNFSISHSQDSTIAIHTNAQNIVGIGIDIETSHPSMKASRNFLTATEASQLSAGQQAHPGVLKKLWSIKEAVFKADPDNHCKTLKYYPIINPEAEQGVIDTGKHTIEYCYTEVQGVSFAIARNLARF